MPIIPPAEQIALPAPAWLLQVLLVATFALHVVAMNLLLTGILTASACSLPGAGERARKLRDRVAAALPAAMSFTVTLGIAPLLFVQALYGQAFFTSSILMAWPWFSVFVFAIIAYYGIYLVHYRPEWLGKLVGIVPWISAALLLFISFLFSANSSQSLYPARWASVYAASPLGLALPLGLPAQLPRWLHILAGAMAVGSLGLQALATRYRAEDPAWAEWAMAIGRRLFSAAAGVAVPLGIWFLVALPEPVRRGLMGQDPVQSTVLLLGIVAAFGALATTRRLLLCGSLAGVSLAAMLVTRHLLRIALLAPAIRAEALAASPQWAVIGLFAAVLVAGAITIGWMTRIWSRQA